MKLSDYIKSSGRVVAYSPKLKQVTGSTTATILLCQLLYWSDKTRDDGWIWKTMIDIEDETGLTDNEQITARKILKNLGILQFEFKRLKHNTRYKINEEILNQRWEDLTGKKVTPIVKEEVPDDGKMHTDDPELNEFFNNKKIEQDKRAALSGNPVIEDLRKRKAAGEKIDAVDTILAFSESAGIKKMRAIALLKEKIETKLKIIASDSRWEKFITFAYGRQEKYNESIDIFLNYAIKEGFDPMYWTPEKMKTIWPQAFAEKENQRKALENFVKETPSVPEKEDYAPMPESLKRKSKPPLEDNI